jgi:hypothetical protein
MDGEELISFERSDFQTLLTNKGKVLFPMGEQTHGLIHARQAL